MIERGPDRDALSLIAGYGEQGDVAAPAMGLRRMVVLAWRTWPYMRPMLVHLVGLVAVMLAGGLTGLVGAFVGVDLFANKVLVGEKLQPHQATVLFVGEDYVTTDPQSLGNGEGAVAGEEDARGAEPELTPEQRRTVRNRLVVWGVAGGVFAAVVAFVFWYYSTWVW